MAYSGTYQPKNPSKYAGDPTKIFYRSLWERQLFRWCDEQSFVRRWSSEEVVIPYVCKTDGKAHRYFVDFKIEFVDGRILLVEVKPKKQTVAPVKPGRKTRKYLTEVVTYAKNISKWEAADEYAKDRGWIFEVWHEDTLRKLGIKIIS